MNSSGAVANGIGQPVRRKEDFRLLTGKGSFADDIQLPGLAHAVIVRSPHAHAHIGSVDKAAALASAGVLAVLTGRDYITDGLAPIPHSAGLMGPPDVAVRVRGSTSPKFWVCRQSKSAACAATWAGTSARGISSIPNTPSSLGPRIGSVDR